MLLSSRDGIKCDLCKAEYRTVFTYYSFDCYQIMVNTKNKYTTKAIPKFEFDVCELCYMNFIDTFSPYEVKVGDQFIKCEKCNTKQSGEFKYFYVYLHKVMVDSNTKSTDVERRILESRMCEKCINGMNDRKRES